MHLNFKKNCFASLGFESCRINTQQISLIELVTFYFIHHNGVMLYRSNGYKCIIAVIPTASLYHL